MIRKDNLLELVHSSRLMKILEFVNKFLSMLTWTTIAWFLREIISLVLCDRVMSDHVISNAHWNWRLLIVTWEIFKVMKVFEVVMQRLLKYILDKKCNAVIC